MRIPRALLLLLPMLCTGCGIAARPANILFVLVDTLRKDHLGVYGYDRPTSPTLDALARSGWVLDNHIATASQTVPSTLSMLLGMYPAEHGFQHREIGQFASYRPMYPEELHFLAEELQAAGYDTAAFVGNPFLQRENGFDQGFDTFVYSDGRGGQLTTPALSWLERPRKRPFFAYLHYFDVHWPYDPPSPFRNLFSDSPDGPLFYNNGPVTGVADDVLERTEALYDGAIAYVDNEIHQLLDRLDHLGLREDTIVIVTSDHGEEFLDHEGMGHGTTVYGEQVRVPMILFYPGMENPGSRIDHLTSHVSVASTLLTLAEVPRGEAFPLSSFLLPAVHAFSEDGPWRGVYGADHKLIWNLASGGAELFRIEDERDQSPLPGTEAPEHTGLQEALTGYRDLELSAATRRETDSADWSQEEKERLRSLGYVQ